ncbi:trypsin-7-like [Anticarsia gemmatalis]|uniref:trypsin-7-like n=1 Tax=Anticarsia gemmatalis TaxID=129554 RepID=UPI003F75A8CD
MWIRRLVVVINTLAIFQCILSQDVGDNCIANNQGLEGKCIEISQCEAAMKAIRNKKFHQFERCGFSGFEEVVCCPQTSNKIGENTNQNRGGNEISGNRAKRIADRECENIIARSIPPLDLHILGGEVASPGEFPHMVALGFDRGNGYEFDCGGSVLSSTYVLTAAHCVDTLDRIEPTIIRAGVVELGSNEWNPDTDVRIAQIILNPRYTRREKYHDLALLRLEQPLQFSSNLNAICLETNDEDPRTPLTITGWGKISNARDTRSNTLLKANVTAVPRGECTESYTNWRKLPSGISADQLCAGDPQGIRDTCQGDSGGPLVSTAPSGHSRLVGVTSFGRGCGSPVPGVYTRVARYLDWLERAVWPTDL